MAAAATEAPPAPSAAREQLSFERYDGPGVTVEVSLEGGRYQVGRLQWPHRLLSGQSIALIRSASNEVPVALRRQCEMLRLSDTALLRCSAAAQYRQTAATLTQRASHDAQIIIIAIECDRPLQVDILAERQRPMMLHWAINDWQLPPAEAQPAGTVQVCSKCL